jgi:hypothetical protein
MNIMIDPLYEEFEDILEDDVTHNEEPDYSEEF